MIAASVQMQPFERNLDRNIQAHISYIEIAASHNAHVILFPELSLTGYTRELSEELIFSSEDKRLDVFSDLSTKLDIAIVIGIPLQSDQGCHISSIIFVPNRSRSIYVKQNLHEGEEISFQASYDYNPTVSLKEDRLAFAICSDIRQLTHPKTAAERGATLYLASLFYTRNGISEAHQQLGQYAEANNIKILMSNYCGHVWNLEAGGQSAYWSNDGKLAANLTQDSKGLLIVDTLTNQSYIHHE